MKCTCSISSSKGERGMNWPTALPSPSSARMQRRRKGKYLGVGTRRTVPSSTCVKGYTKGLSSCRRTCVHKADSKKHIVCVALPQMNLAWSTVSAVNTYNCKMSSQLGRDGAIESKQNDCHINLCCTMARLSGIN